MIALLVHENSLKVAQKVELRGFELTIIIAINNMRGTAEEDGMVGASGFEQSPLIKKLPSGVAVRGIDDWVRRLVITNRDV